MPNESKALTATNKK